MDCPRSARRSGFALKNIPSGKGFLDGSALTAISAFGASGQV
jgi:hypothetical protein